MSHDPPVRPHDAGVSVHAGAPLPGPGPAPRPAHLTIAHLVPVVRRAGRRVIADLAQLYGSEHGDTLLHIPHMIEFNEFLSV